MDSPIFYGEYMSFFLIDQEHDFQCFKGVEDCPHCGGRSYFGVCSSSSYKVTCSLCKSSGPEVNLPDYWGKGMKRLWSRLYTRAVVPWNKRNGFMI